MNTECIFCKIAGKEIPTEIVFENEDVVAFNDLNPKAPVHVLFIPKKHVATLNDLSDDDSDMVGKIFSAIKDVAAKKGISVGGYRVVANCNKDAGQEVFHIHFHLLGGRALTWPPG